MNASRKPTDFHGYDLSNADLSEMNLFQLNFQGADLSKADLRAWYFKTDLRQAKLPKIFFETDLSGAHNLNERWLRCTVALSYLDDEHLLLRLGVPNIDHNERLSREDFSNEDLSFCGLSNLFLYRADFSGAHLQNSNLAASSLRLVDLSTSNLDGANLLFTEIKSMVRGLVAGQLSKTINWQFAELPKDLDGIQGHLKNDSVHNCVFDGIKPVDHGFPLADLHNVSWRSADLSYVSFVQANLRHVNFSRSDLTGATFEFADIEWADFRGATGLNRGQISRTRNWNAAYFDADVPSVLELPQDHNETLDRLQGLLPKDEMLCAPQVPKFPGNPNVR